MFTVRRLGIDSTLARTLVCTNMIESMISICRTTSGNVKRWRDDGDMRRRWCAAGLLEAERKFRRLRGHRQMPALVAALRRHAAAVTPPCDTDNNEIAA
jgi:putative transposase